MNSNLKLKLKLKKQFDFLAKESEKSSVSAKIYV